MGFDVDYDTDKVDEAVMALLYLTMFEDRGVTRAWKGHDWDALNRLFDRGWISDPKGKAKSVVLTDEGVRAAEKLFRRHFAKAVHQAAVADRRSRGRRQCGESGAAAERRCVGQAKGRRSP